MTDNVKAYNEQVVTARARCKLRAAAPDLLMACKARLECDEVFEQGTSEWHQSVDCADAMMREAITKAEG